MRQIDDFLQRSRYTTHQRAPFFRIACDHHVAPGRVLDAGAGNGEFADMLGAADVHLIESNPATAALLRERYRNVHELRLPAPLPFKDGYFQLIHSSHLIEHLYPHELYALFAELDRCLAPGGHLVVSTPLLWDGFYDDLSHVKPYAPKVLAKYFCQPSAGDKQQRTRSAIAADYETVRLVYRYRLTRPPTLGLAVRIGWLRQAFHALFSVLSALGPSQYAKTGYTMVLRKPGPAPAGAVAPA